MIQETISITLPAEVKPVMDDIMRKEGVSSSELVSKAIKEYLFFRQFRLLRERLIPKAQEQGIYTDQDVFDVVS